MPKPLIISVVRDITMYEKCIGENPFCQTCDKLMLDNRTENLGIPKRYNQAIDALDPSAPRWLIFCHEDFEPLEYLGGVVNDLDTSSIYGPIGIRLAPKKRWLLGGIWPTQMLGQISQTDRNGTVEKTVGVITQGETVVDTLDCCCLIVHSSLITDRALRFDENLSFDLYAEDLCTAAFTRHGILSRIARFKCCHHSSGSYLPRLYEQKRYLDGKYPRAEMATICTITIGGGRTPMRRFQKRTRVFLDQHAPWLVRFIFRHLPG